MIRALIPALLLAGCNQGLWVSDPFDSKLQPLFGERQDALLSPYLLDSSFVIELNGPDSRIEDMTLHSSNPSVLSLGETSHVMDQNNLKVTAIATATGSGSATIEVHDDNGKVRHEVDVEVAAPDRVDLVPVQRVLINEYSLDPNSTTLADPVLYIDALAEFELHPSTNGESLAGTATPTLIPSAGMIAEFGGLRTSNLHDVIALSASELGSHTLQIEYATAGTQSYSLTATDTVASLEVMCQASGVEETTANGYCVSIAKDAQSGPIYGVMPKWSVNDDAQSGKGDLLQWTRGDGSDETVDVAVSFGEVTATGKYTGSPDDPTVESSNDITICGTRTVGGLWLGAPALLMLGLRRRKQSAQRS